MITLKTALIEFCTSKCLLLGGLIFLVSLNLLAQRDTVKLGSDIWPPFTNEGKQGNHAADLVKVALLRAGVEMNFEILDWDGLLESIKKGDLDGSPAMWRSPEREEFLHYSMPYLHNQLILVGPKGSDVDIMSLPELLQVDSSSII